MFDRIAREHGEDLRREAAAYRLTHGGGRVASRADRAAPRVAARVSHAVLRHALHRNPVVAGCEA